MLVNCRDCGGSGRKGGGYLGTHYNCYTCGGTGKVPESQPLATLPKTTNKHEEKIR